MDLETKNRGQKNNYTDCPLTNFPAGEDTWNRMMDINTVLLPLMKQYNAYAEAGNLSAANKIIQDNPDLLDCLFNAEKFNWLRDAIIAMERYYLEDVQTFIMNVAQNTVGINDSPTDEQAVTVAYSAKKVKELLAEIRQLIGTADGHLKVLAKTVDKLHRRRTLTLTAAGWSPSYPYTQTVAADGVTADDSITVIGVNIPDGSTADQVKAWNKAAGVLMHNPGGVGAGSITFKAYKKPAADVTVITEGA